MQNNPIIIIPARMKATRFPNKPLFKIAGLPMIVHCMLRAREADIAPVLIAAGDKEIYDCIRDYGGNAVMTAPDLPSGSDRIYAALQLYDKAGAHDIIINMQGDLPTLSPDLLPSVMEPLLQNARCDIATICATIINKDEVNNENVVKIFTALSPDRPIARALAFSRAPIPHGDGAHFHHIGLYAYRRAALQKFVTLPVGILEQRERLEQLRALENDLRIDVALVDTVPLGVDTMDDAVVAERLLA